MSRPPTICRALAAVLLCASPGPAQAGPYDDIQRDLAAATEAMTRGDFAAAETMLAAVVARAPKIATAWYQLAICRHQQSKPEAAAAAHQAIELLPDDPGPRLLAARIHRESDPEQARALVEQLLTGEPADAVVRKVVPIAIELGLHGPAERQLERALRLRPTDIGLLELRAELAIETRDLPKAAECLERRLAVERRDPDVLISLIHVYLAMPDRTRAIGAAERTLQVNPSNRIVRALLIDLLRSAGAQADRIAAHARLLEVYEQRDGGPGKPVGGQGR